MRNMSFFYTRRQFEDRSKNVTRRLGWLFLKAGELFMGVEKAQGLGKGGKIKRLGIAQAVCVQREPLNRITQQDVNREGFPEMTRGEFIFMFCKHMKCFPWTVVTRIEFRRMG